MLVAYRLVTACTKYYVIVHGNLLFQILIRKVKCLEFLVSRFMEERDRCGEVRSFVFVPVLEFYAEVSYEKRLL